MIENIQINLNLSTSENILTLRTYCGANVHHRFLQKLIIFRNTIKCRSIFYSFIFLLSFFLSFLLLSCRLLHYHRQISNFSSLIKKLKLIDSRAERSYKSATIVGANLHLYVLGFSHQMCAQRVNREWSSSTSVFTACVVYTFIFLLTLFTDTYSRREDNCDRFVFDKTLTRVLPIEMNLI